MNRHPTIQAELEKERVQRLLERQQKKADAIANRERDAPIRVRFHEWLGTAGFSPQQMPKPGAVYMGAHLETLWEAYVDASLKERAEK